MLAPEGRNLEGNITTYFPTATASRGVVCMSLPFMHLLQSFTSKMYVKNSNKTRLRVMLVITIFSR